MQNKNFHNYAGVQKDICDSYDIICFYGESGSWKSSYIHYILEANPQKNIKLIDEVLTLYDFLKIIPQIVRKKPLLIATHQPLFLYNFFTLLSKKVITFNLEQYPLKIEHYLTEKWYSYSQQILEEYKSKFKNTYTDIDIILETSFSEEKDFDIIFREFMKNNSLTMSPNA